MAALRSRVARLSYYFVRFSAWISLRAAAFRPWRFVRPRFGAELSSYASTFSSAGPSPATHAIFRLLKAGETVRQALFVPDRVAFTLN